MVQVREVSEGRRDGACQLVLMQMTEEKEKERERKQDNENLKV